VPPYCWIWQFRLCRPSRRPLGSFRTGRREVGARERTVPSSLRVPGRAFVRPTTMFVNNSGVSRT
jgi:hypothetical protein